MYIHLGNRLIHKAITVQSHNSRKWKIGKGHYVFIRLL